MIRNELFKRITTIPYRVLFVKHNSSSQINIEKLEQDTDLPDVIDDEALRKEEEIQRKRNKSRLKTADYNMLHEHNPYHEATIWQHGTLKYLRRTYGRYGAESGVDPAICFPTKNELEDRKKYESIAYPFTISEVVTATKIKRQKKNEEIRLRQEHIVQKMAKLEEMKKELFSKIAKKEADTLAAKERKERLVDEVRRHFGYTVDPRDEKFKEMLEKKEKEQKKLMKEARRKEKEEKMVTKMLKKKENPTKETEVEEK